MLVSIQLSKTRATDLSLPYMCTNVAWFDLAWLREREVRLDVYGHIAETVERAFHRRPDDAVSVEHRFGLFIRAFGL